MENLLDIQKSFFQQIKDSISPQLSFIHEVAEILGTSYDSAYRRVRGETTLSLEELYRLSIRFGISVDSLFNIPGQNINFNYHAADQGTLNISEWFGLILTDLKEVTQAREKEIIYTAKDIPMFHYFNFPEIAAFKLYFWQKTLFNFPDFAEKKFRIDDTDPVLMQTGKHILSLSSKIPTIEIWNEDTFNMTLRQIEYCWVSGYFSSKDDLLNLCDKLQLWIHHFYRQAECGYKFIYGQTPEGIENSFILYQNEVVLNDNTIFVKTDGKIRVYLTFNVIGLLITHNPDFCSYIENHFKGLLKQSNLISLSGTKERNRFFNHMNLLISEFCKKINNSVSF